METRHTLFVTALVATLVSGTGAHALAAEQDAIHKGTLTLADYQALATTVDAQVATIVAELLAGAEAMQGKSASKPVAGALHTVQAVNRYGQYFDHPEWQALR